MTDALVMLADSVTGTTLPVGTGFVPIHLGLLALVGARLKTPAIIVSTERYELHVYRRRSETLVLLLERTRRRCP
jgi:hypothetical protein